MSLQKDLEFISLSISVTTTILYGRAINCVNIFGSEESGNL